MKNPFIQHATPLSLKRAPLISSEQSGRVHELAKHILSETGMEVRDAGLRQKLRAAGLVESGERILFEAAVVDDFVNTMRSHLVSHEPSPAQDDGCIHLSVSSYSLFVHDLESGKVVPFTSESLIEMTKLVDSFADEGVHGAPPGIPGDVDPALQPLAQYRIAAMYARQGATPVDPTSAKTVHHLLDMAEVMGNPVDGLPVYIPTPLRLGGESLDVVLACLDRIEHVWVSSMPATATSAPLQPFGALALAAAEVIGGAIAVQILTGKPTSFGVNIFPSDLREGSMVFGSPENMLFNMLSADLNRFYGWQPGWGHDNFHVMAKMPDCQSAGEKAAILALGAGLGTHHFSCAGTLSLDEIFSAEQLLVDCELRDWTQRAIAGVRLGEEEAADWLGEVRSGISGGFIALDSTLDHHREQIWYPKMFARGAIGPWLNQGQPEMAGRLLAEVRRRIAKHEFELDAVKRADIERIYRAAEREIME